MDLKSEHVERFILDLGVTVVVTVVSTLSFLLAEEVLKNRLLSFFAATTFFLGCLVAWGFLRARRKRRQTESRLHLLGIDRVFESHYEAPKWLVVIQQANRSIRFMGISGRTLFEEEAVEDTLRSKIRSGVDCRFLIFSPNSVHLDAKAREEGDDPKAWRHDIDASVARLQALGAVRDGSVVTRFYRAKPIWRLLIVDDARCYVSCYQRGHRGKHAPVALLAAERSGFFSAMCDTFEQAWVDSEPG